MSAVSETSDLTEPISTPAPNLPNQQLDGETLIGWDENETASSGYSGGVCFYSVYANSFSSVSLSPY